MVHFTSFKSNICSNTQYLVKNFNDTRYSPKGRLMIICLLIAGLILLLWGVILFIGLNFISNSALTSSWVIVLTLFTEKLTMMTNFSVLNMAILLVTLGSIVFFTMSLLLPRIQNIPKNERILL